MTDLVHGEKVSQDLERMQKKERRSTLMEALGEATNSGDTSLVSLLREGIRRSLQTFSSSPVWGFYVDCLLWRKRPNNFSCNFLVL